MNGSFNEDSSGYGPDGDKILLSKGPDQADLINISFSLIICAVGLLGNAVVIFVIVVLKDYQKSITNWYVLQLAIADSLFLCSIPLDVAEIFLNAWPFSEALCQFKKTLLFLNYYASVLFLVIMSFDRYIAVCHSFQSKLSRYRTHAISRYIAVATWATALLLCIPITIHTNKMGEQPRCLCVYNFPNYEQECLDEGFKISTIDECLDTKKDLLDALNGVERYCRKSEVDELVDGSTQDEYETNTMYSDIYSLGLLRTKITLPYITLTLKIFLRVIPVYRRITRSEEYFTNNSFDDSEDVISVNYPHALSDDTSFSSTPNEVEYSLKCNYRYFSSGWTAFLIFNFIAMFVLPFVVMAFCYQQIVATYKGSRKRVRNMSSISRPTKGPGKKRSRLLSVGSINEQRKVTLMCVLLVGSFGVLWLPFHAFHLAKLHGIPLTVANDDLCDSLQLFTALLVYLNSTINPFLYSGWGKKFRKRMRRASGSVKHSLRPSRSKGTDSVRYKRRQDGSSSFMATQVTEVNKIDQSTPNNWQNSKAEIVEYNETDVTLSAPVLKDCSKEETEEFDLALSQLDSVCKIEEGTAFFAEMCEISNNNVSGKTETINDRETEIKDKDKVGNAFSDANDSIYESEGIETKVGEFTNLNTTLV